MRAREGTEGVVIARLRSLNQLRFRPARARRRRSGSFQFTSDKGDILPERATGLVNRAFSVPNTLTTKFQVGSITKMFTAVAAAQLTASGKLSFDDSMSKYLPDYPDQAVAFRITLHHLLTNTSGLGDYQSAEYDESRWQLKGLAEYYPVFAKQGSFSRVVVVRILQQVLTVLRPKPG